MTPLLSFAALVTWPSHEVTSRSSCSSTLANTSVEATKALSKAHSSDSSVEWPLNYPCFNIPCVYIINTRKGSTALTITRHCNQSGFDILLKYQQSMIPLICNVSKLLLSLSLSMSICLHLSFSLSLSLSLSPYLVSFVEYSWTHCRIS